MVPESPLKWYEDFVYKYIFWGKDSCLHMFWPIVWFPLRRLASEISTWTSQQVSPRYHPGLCFSLTLPILRTRSCFLVHIWSYKEITSVYHRLLYKFGFRSEVNGDVLLRTEFLGAGTWVLFLGVHKICFGLDLDDLIGLRDWLPCIPFTSSSEVGACLA